MFAARKAKPYHCHHLIIKFIAGIVQTAMIKLWAANHLNPLSKLMCIPVKIFMTELYSLLPPFLMIILPGRGPSGPLFAIKECLVQA